jgi:hypothetical protein
MFVRWQSRKRLNPAVGRKGDHHPEDVEELRYNVARHYLPGTTEQDRHWAASLVEAIWVDGKPTQRHIAYLGGITTSAIAAPAWQREFWDHVMQVLDGLQLPPADRRKVVTAVAKKVGPPPTARQRQQLDRQSAAALKRWGML